MFLGNLPASVSAGVSKLSIRSPFIGVERTSDTLYAYEDGTDRKFRNVGTKSSDAGRIPQKTQHCIQHKTKVWNQVNPLNAELNPICHLLALVGVHHILHVSRVRVKHWFPFHWNTESTSGWTLAILCPLLLYSTTTKLSKILDLFNPKTCD